MAKSPNCGYSVRNKYGKNAVLKGMNYLPKGTARYRNMTIGGHKA